jgi:hypothetical protein
MAKRAADNDTDALREEAKAETSFDLAASVPNEVFIHEILSRVSMLDRRIVGQVDKNLERLIKDSMAFVRASAVLTKEQMLEWTVSNASVAQLEWLFDTKGVPFPETNEEKYWLVTRIVRHGQVDMLKMLLGKMEKTTEGGDFLLYMNEARWAPKLVLKALENSAAMIDAVQDTFEKAAKKKFQRELIERASFLADLATDAFCRLVDKLGPVYYDSAHTIAGLVTYGRLHELKYLIKANKRAKQQFHDPMLFYHLFGSLGRSKKRDRDMFNYLCDQFDQFYPRFPHAKYDVWTGIADGVSKIVEKSRMVQEGDEDNPYKDAAHRLDLYPLEFMTFLVEDAKVSFINPVSEYNMILKMICNGSAVLELLQWYEAHGGELVSQIATAAAVNYDVNPNAFHWLIQHGCLYNKEECLREAQEEGVSNEGIAYIRSLP